MFREGWPVSAASWAVLDEQNVYYPFRQDRLKADYAMWRAYQPVADVTSEEDWTIVTTQLHAQTGARKHEVARYLDALEVLDRLPRLRALVEKAFLLDMNHLSTIEKAVRKAPLPLQDDEFFWRELDADLMERFTPSRPRQLLPSSHAITKAVTATIRSIEDLAAVQGENPWGAPEPEAGPRPCENPGELMSSLPPAEDPAAQLYAEELTGGDIRIEMIVDQATGTRILDAVDQVAEERDTSRAGALRDLILEKITTRVTMMLYSAKDIGDSPVHHADRGILTPSCVKVLKELVTGTLDMDEAANARTTAYGTSPRIRAYLIGRDYICRWPGCGRRATHCDADHCINHDDGGPTTPSNMIMLCRHHHNRKTDEQIFYFLDPHTADVYWLFKDGTWAVDEATGPLAPKQRRWVQTWVQRRERYRARLAQQAARERFDAYQERINSPAPPVETPEHPVEWLAPPDEDPPPI